jgi:multidrug efflux system membrane fusion protein
MKAAGTSRPHPPLGKLVSLAILAIAIALGFYALHRSALLPSTDAAPIDADIVHVAASVGGRIISIPVSENALVSEGDLLFQIDPVPYRLAVSQAEADLDLAEAALATQRRVLSTQRSAAAVAKEQTRRATTNLELATRTVERLRPLAAKGYVPTQQLDQAQTAQHDAETSLLQAGSRKPRLSARSTRRREPRRRFGLGRLRSRLHGARLKILQFLLRMPAGWRA